MDKIAKAIGAAQGGTTSAAAVVAAAMAFVQFLPPDVHVPWWGYIIFIVLAMVFCMVPPFIGAYLAPSNSGAQAPVNVVPIAHVADAVKTGVAAAVAASVQPGNAP